jgi:hypothetical protein
VALITRDAVRLDPVERVTGWSVGSLPFGQSGKLSCAPMIFPEG